MVAERPVLTLLSGPAAGVIGGDWAGGLSGRRNLITFDIGGTCGRHRHRHRGRLRRGDGARHLDRRLPGAGADDRRAHHRRRRRLDRLRRPRPAPSRSGRASAGAVPGPAAYGQGGTRADGDRRQRRARPPRRRQLPGRRACRSTRWRRGGVIGELARELGLSDREAAEGVVTVINANMANAIRSRTVQKGIDPRDYALVAFGGAGPLHGAEVADMLGIPEVIVPPHPGITSAVGLLTTDLSYDAIRTSFQVSRRGRPRAHQRRLRATMEGARRPLRRRRHRRSAGVTFERRGDLRYVGQGYELRVPIPDGTIDAAGAGRGVRGLPRDPSARVRPPLPPSSAIEIVNLRLVGAASAAEDRQAGGRHGHVARGGQGARPAPAPSASTASSPTIRRPSTAATCCRSASASPARRSCCRWIRPPSCRRSTAVEADAAGNLIIRSEQAHERQLRPSAASRRPSPTASTRSPPA